MAYSLVPDSANTVGSDLTAMYDNFVALESSQIVDSGTTADGDYWRFEDGLQICISSIFTVSATFLASPGMYRSGGSERALWYFPQPFISAPYVKTTLKENIADDSANSYGIEVNIEVGSCELGIGTIKGPLNDIGVKGFAIGRWK